MANHRVRCQRNPLNRSIGAGLVASGIALGSAALCVPATASADVQVGGQNNSPGASGGNITGADFSNNTVVLGRSNTTRVNQSNQNSSGGNITGLDISNNTIVLGRGNATQVNQSNQNSSGGDRNGAATVPAANTNPFLVPFQIGGQNNSPGASGGNITGIDASNNVLVIG